MKHYAPNICLLIQCRCYMQNDKVVEREIILFNIKQNCAKIVLDYFHLGQKLYAKYQDSSSCSSSDILFTRFIG